MGRVSAGSNRSIPLLRVVESVLTTIMGPTSGLLRLLPPVLGRDDDIRWIRTNRSSSCKGPRRRIASSSRRLGPAPGAQASPTLSSLHPSRFQIVELGNRGHRWSVADVSLTTARDFLSLAGAPSCAVLRPLPWRLARNDKGNNDWLAPHAETRLPQGPLFRVERVHFPRES